MHEGWQRLPTARRRRGLVRFIAPRVWLRISDEPRPVEVASVAERLARVVLRQARELGEEDIARARRFRLGHGRSGLLLRRQKRLARWASHAGPAMMYTSSVLRLLMEGRARRVLGCPSRRGDSISRACNCASLCGRCGAHARRRRGRPRGAKECDLLRKKKKKKTLPPTPTAYHRGARLHPNKTRASAAPTGAPGPGPLNRARPTAPARRGAPGAP